MQPCAGEDALGSSAWSGSCLSDFRDSCGRRHRASLCHPSASHLQSPGTGLGAVALKGGPVKGPLSLCQPRGLGWEGRSAPVLTGGCLPALGAPQPPAPVQSPGLICRVCMACGGRGVGAGGCEHKHETGTGGCPQAPQLPQGAQTRLPLEFSSQPTVRGKGPGSEAPSVFLAVQVTLLPC